MSDYIPLHPEYDRIAELVTYQDVVERVLTHFDRHGEERDLYLARQSVADALRELARHRWKWYTSTFLLTTEADYDTGTIAYTHSTRAVTLTSGTWPSNAAWGAIKIDGVVYLVASRDSSTQITLRADGNPGADVAASTDYHWFREVYPLPPGFVSMHEPRDTAFALGGPDMLRARSDQVLSIRRLHSATPTAYPSWYSIERDPRRLGKVIVVCPPPNEARTYEFTYRRDPRPLRVEKYSTGTVSVTSGGTAVTGSSTVWTSKHVGCVIRFSENTTAEPTSQYGGRRDTGLDLHQNPATFSRIVTAVGSSTGLTIDAAADSTLSGVRYTLSDPVDVDWEMCGEYFARLVEWMFAQNSHEMAVGEREGNPIAARKQQALDAFHRAADRDRMSDAVPQAAPPWADWFGYLGPDNVSTEYE